MLFLIDSYKKISVIKNLTALNKIRQACLIDNPSFAFLLIRNHSIKIASLISKLKITS
jgi:hypothetical protein